MPPQPVPCVSPIFLAREAELARVCEALDSYAISVIYGVAGVGKSALAYASAARWQGPVLYCKASCDPLSALLDDMRRQLAGGVSSERLNDQERLADLIASLDRCGYLWVLDDLHMLEPGTRSDLVSQLARGLRRGRVVVTSRERLPISGSDADRFELLLEGLDREAAQALWKSLDVLYGPSAGFDRAWQRSRGNPFQLRRAHAGGLDDADPVAAALEALGPEEQLVARALALLQVRLPVTTLVRLLPPQLARSTLRRLTSLLMIDIDGEECAGIHDLFRDAIQENFAPNDPARRAIHQSLAGILQDDAKLDPIVRIREVCRHLCAIEAYQEAGKFLVEHSTELVRKGATGELLRALEAIPRERRSADVRLTRARCLARLLDMTRAYEELEQLVAGDANAGAEVKLSLAQVAIATGKLRVADRLLRQVLKAPQLTAKARLGAIAARALIQTHQGRGEAARRSLFKAEAQAVNSFEAGVLAAWRALLLCFEERDVQAEQPMRRARALLAEAPPSSLVMRRLPTAFAGILARLGRFEEAEATLRSIESSQREEDLVSRVYLRGMRGTLLYERGDRLDALQMFCEVAETFERGGHVVGALWSQAWVGRVELLIGRRRQGLATLDAVAQRAQRLGLASTLATVERSRQFDLPRQLRLDQTECQSPSGSGWRVRAQSLEALRAAAAGDRSKMESLIRQIASLIEAPGYALDWVLVLLSTAALARVEGQDLETGAELSRAVRIANEAQIDSDLIPAILEAVGNLRLVTRATACLAHRAPRNLRHFGIVLDGRTHELKARRRCVSLRHRPLLRRLLYALAARPESVVAKEVLVDRVWCAEYNPLVHDNPLWVNTRRLRSILQDSGLSIELVDDGYRLSVSERFLFIDPGPREHSEPSARR